MAGITKSSSDVQMSTSTEPSWESTRHTGHMMLPARQIPEAQDAGKLS